MKRYIIFLFLSLTSYVFVVAQNEQSRPEIDIVYWDVPLIPQPKSMSCWATSAAMVMAWRDNNPSMKPKDVVTGKGKWENYFKNNTGLPVNELGFGTAKQFFDSLGLEPLPKQCFTPQGLAGFLDSGPIWVAVPGHAVVITGMWGDGTSEGTTVYVNNPWDTDNPYLGTLHWLNDQVEFNHQNKGKREVFTFAEFSDKMENMQKLVMKILEEGKRHGKITEEQIRQFYSHDFYAAH